MICNNCEINIKDIQSGFIKIIENHGIEYDEEVYYFCSYKCLCSWYDFS